MKVLVSSWDRLGSEMAGSAIRALEMARALALAGHRVTLAAPVMSEIQAQSGLELVPLVDPSVFGRLVDRCDVVVISGRTELMTAIGKPLVVDLYDPFLLSNLDLFGHDFNRAGGRALLSLRWLQHHLATADFFLCASEAQRSFWLGMLAAAGRVNRANYEGDPMLERLLAVVPFGIPAQPPPPSGSPVIKGVVPGVEKEDRVILWSGGLWNWVDPLTLIRATAQLRESRADLKTVIVGGRHPNPEIGEMEMAKKARSLSDELGLTGRGVSFVPWVPYRERAAWIQEADVGVSLHQRGVESQFAFRTRLLDLLWCDQPMVVTAGDELSALVGERKLGWVVPPGDEDAVAGALEAALSAPVDLDQSRRFAQVREDFSWPRVVQPLEEFCRQPRSAPDHAGDAWLARPLERKELPRKEQALVSQEFTGDSRTLSEALGPDYAPSQPFRSRYNRLCQIDVLIWFDAPLDESVLVFELYEVGTPQRVLARVALPAAQLPQDGWQRFEFRPIEGSREHDFAFRLRLEHAPGVWDVRGRVCVWHGASASGESAGPLAFIARYLIDGVEEHLPVAADEFLFLHNTTLAVPQDAAALASQAVAEPGPVAGDVDTLRAALARQTLSTREAGVRAAQLSDELRAAREELESRTIGSLLGRFGRILFSLLLTFGMVWISVFLAMLLWMGDRLPVRRRDDGLAPDARPARPDDPVSVVIPSWNGSELLDMSLPPLIAALRRHGHPDDEIVVVDNGSDDETLEALERHKAEFPGLRVIALDRNHGFGGATNRGAREARNPILILLNNDMVVEDDFVQPLLDVFGEEPNVFGVSCQIDFIDLSRPRWETGKVHAELHQGIVRLFHLDRFDEDKIYPVFFAGGGASAYDRERFLALGGFDEAVFSPVYIEDVDLGYRAWKRGWSSLLAPRSRVHHKHRGTTRRLWSEATIHSFFVKNLVALLWKNTSSRSLLGQHLLGLVTLPERVRREHGSRAALATVRGLIRQIPIVSRARREERSRPRRFSDEEILAISRYRHVYRAYFHPEEERVDSRRQVLVISPYSPLPALHGGAVRMLNLIREMGKRCDVTLLSFVDTPAESEPDSLAELEKLCRDVILVPRDLRGAGGVLLPLSAHGFVSHRMYDLIETWLEKRRFDVVQIEYTNMAHYMPPASPGTLRVLVEHDVSFVAARRAREAEPAPLRRMALWVDGLRMFRHEIESVEEADRVLAMSETDRGTLGRFVDPKSIAVVPNGVSFHDFPFAPARAEPATLLFVGFFRHEPNVEAVLYFAREILPLVRREIPEVIFRVAGAYPPAAVRSLAEADAGIEILGRVPETASHYQRATVFVAPILRGSGTRLKILEAMASGCPVVSTKIGAEGLGAGPQEIEIADDPATFAAATVELVRNRELRTEMVEKAHSFAERNYDWAAVAEKLFAAYGWPSQDEQDRGEKR